ncbi:MAG: hypothetical protein L0220_19080 [Acidobacteria bacterium]|nr:hypothetical protein [Acidobacteriota bacterium]
MTDTVETIVSQVRQLPLADQLLLIQRVAEELRFETSPDRQKAMVYGKYRRAPDEMSTEEDFKLAEWRPSESDLNGK